MCHGSHHQPINSPQPVSSHHDQVHCTRFGQGEDQIGYRAVLHEALGSNLVRRVAFRKLLKLLFGVGAESLTGLLTTICLTAISCKTFRKRVQNVLQEQRRLVAPG